MPLESSLNEASAQGASITSSTEDLCHDTVTYTDTNTTLTALTRMKEMYALEQGVTQLIIDDMKTEGENINKIGVEFNVVEELITNKISNL